MLSKICKLSPQKHDHTFDTRANQHGYIGPVMNNMLLEIVRMQNKRDQLIRYYITTSKHLKPIKNSNTTFQGINR